MAKNGDAAGGEARVCVRASCVVHAAMQQGHPPPGPAADPPTGGDPRSAGLCCCCRRCCCCCCCCCCRRPHPPLRASGRGCGSATRAYSRRRHTRAPRRCRCRWHGRGSGRARGRGRASVSGSRGRSRRRCTRGRDRGCARGCARGRACPPPSPAGCTARSSDGVGVGGVGKQERGYVGRIGAAAVHAGALVAVLAIGRGHTHNGRRRQREAWRSSMSGGSTHKRSNAGGQMCSTHLLLHLLQVKAAHSKHVVDRHLGTLRTPAQHAQQGRLVAMQGSAIAPSGCKRLRRERNCAAGFACAQASVMRRARARHRRRAARTHAHIHAPHHTHTHASAPDLRH